MCTAERRTELDGRRGKNERTGGEGIPNNIINSSDHVWRMTRTTTTKCTLPIATRGFSRVPISCRRRHTVQIGFCRCTFVCVCVFVCVFVCVCVWRVRVLLSPIDVPRKNLADGPGGKGAWGHPALDIITLFIIIYNT